MHHDDEEARSIDDLVNHGDVAELCTRIDSLVLDEDWSSVVDVRDRCRSAIERGRQLWPAAAWAEYRLCLDAPGRFAAPVVDSPAARFTLGPFAEVMASTKRWDELAPWLPNTPGRDAVAYERAVRGDDLRADDGLHSIAEAVGIPLGLAAWEPRYPLAQYHLDRVDWLLPEELATSASRGAHVVTTAGRTIDDGPTVHALRDMVKSWTAESNGSARACAVDGSAPEAIGALAVEEASIAAVSAADALTIIAWAAGGGGAHGRRRGAATGRFEAWWVASHLTGMAEDWPLHADELGDALGDLRWWTWTDPARPIEPDGWACRLAIEAPAEGLAWAVDAFDRR